MVDGVLEPPETKTGTLPMMAPEQIRAMFHNLKGEDKPSLLCDRRASDFWSCLVTVLDIVLGDLPFTPYIVTKLPAELKGKANAK